MTVTGKPSRSNSVGEPCPDCGEMMTEICAGGLLAYCWNCTDRAGGQK